MKDYKLILASGSPRRKEILEMLDIEFQVLSKDINEDFMNNETPYEYVHRLAIEKGEAVATNFDKNTIIISGDVTVDIDGMALAKAETKEHAYEMIQQIQGRTHYIRNAYAIHFRNELYDSGVVTVPVSFKEMDESTITDYINAEDADWDDKAGAYAIQGKAKKFITRIQGSYYDILGLPIYKVGVSLANIYNDKSLLEKLPEIFEKEPQI